MNPLNVFKNIGKGILKGIGLVERGLGIVANELTDEQLQHAVRLVKAAADQFVDKAARREWCVAELQSLGLPEWLSRLAVEVALKLVKKEAEKAINKTIDKARADAPKL